jgi:diaminohydroxyphosphoribosylaminopyrimidine deaminase / 5-amino-6-(5-phosphoribosylamino)uracil reductase
VSRVPDAAAAWALVRALAGMVSDEGEAPGRVRGPTGALLALDEGGRWTTDPLPSPEASAILDLYVPLAVRRDFVVGQIGQSLDGRVATESGESHYVTGPEDIVRLHRLRALVDAVIVGAGTAVSDRPRLTVRRAEGSNPARVVLDPNGRVPPEGPLFADAAAPTLWVRGGTAETDLLEHVEVVTPPERGVGGDVPPRALVSLLRERGHRRILVEGGGVTVSRFLAAGALDRLHVTVSPMIIGSGRQGLSLPVIDDLEGALRPGCRHFRLGADILFDLDLRAGPAGSPIGSDATETGPATPPNRSA